MAKKNTETLASITCLHLMKHMCFCDVTNGAEPKGKCLVGFRSLEISKKAEKTSFKVSETLIVLKNQSRLQ